MAKGRDYLVGYGNPPVEHQFKKGRSGNPAGRPKKKRDSFHEMFERMLGEKVTVNQNGQPQKITREEAVMLKALEKALTGKGNEATKFLELIAKLRAVGAKLSQTKAMDEHVKTKTGVLLLPTPASSVEQWLKETENMLLAGWKYDVHGNIVEDPDHE
jgi:hypothetical protein